MLVGSYGQRIHVIYPFAIYKRGSDLRNRTCSYVTPGFAKNNKLDVVSYNAMANP